MLMIYFVDYKLGLHGYTGYSTTKYGLRGLAEVLQMEVKPYNIGVSISFPPDTNTPQLQAELEHRDSIQKELASYGAWSNKIYLKATKLCMWFIILCE